MLPVNSEHNAIFQVFDPDQHRAVDRLILTASGGPFRNWSLATWPTRRRSRHWPSQLGHGRQDLHQFGDDDEQGPRADRGAAAFRPAGGQVDIVVHPQSVIHSMVAYRDGSVLAQLGTADMRMPITHALGWPARIDGPAARLDFTQHSGPHVRAARFRPLSGLRLAREALVTGGYAPIVLNAANEAAVAAFLARRIGFLDIARIVEDVMAGLERTFGCGRCAPAGAPADLEARRRAETSAGQGVGKLM